MTIKITKMASVDMYLTTGGVKIRVLGYFQEIFFTVASLSLAGPHFPYITMVMKGGNSTEATLRIGLFLPNTKRGQCVGLAHCMYIESDWNGSQSIKKWIIFSYRTTIMIKRRVF
mgnify:CR=1 FL=1